MSDAGIGLALAAERYVGTPFRLHGRDPATGLDCVGLVEWALRDIGQEAVLPIGYSLRNCEIDNWLVFARRARFFSVSDTIKPGDVLLAMPGPLQHHLLIAGQSGAFVHAHAGLRRVVASPPPCLWPVLHHWRLLPKI